MQIKRRKSRRLWHSDIGALTVTLCGLALFALSWGYFQSHLLQRVSGKPHRTGRRQGQHATNPSSHDSQAQGAAASISSPAGDAATSFCEAHFGMDWVRAWNASRQQVCSPSPATLASSRGSSSGGVSSITCGTPDPDDHLPPASGPHRLCDATNLLLDPSKLRRARCPKHRPNYLCQSNTYHHYLQGAWAAACNWPDFQLSYFSKDHMQDIFGGMVLGYEALPALEAGQVERLPTLIVTREINEHANVFHTLTDMLNVYITLLMLGWQDAPRQVLILDEHPPASLDILWPLVAAGGGAEVLAQEGDPWHARQGPRRLVRRAEELPGPVVFQRAAFVPPGYTSLLFAHLYEEPSCRQATALFRGFREFMLAPFGLGAAAARMRDPGAPLAVRLVSRRPSKKWRRMARQIANENALLGMLRQVATAAAASQHTEASSAAGATGPLQSVEVSLLDLSELSLEEQLKVIAGTDILIGMHGAALAYSMLMAPHAAVVELWPQQDGVWRCYENMSLWAGLLYRRLANTDPSKYQNTPTGDKTSVDVDSLQRIVEELLPAVQRRRRAGHAAAGALAGGAT